MATAKEKHIPSSCIASVFRLVSAFRLCHTARFLTKLHLCARILSEAVAERIGVGGSRCDRLPQ